MSRIQLIVLIGQLFFSLIATAQIRQKSSIGHTVTAFQSSVHYGYGSTSVLRPTAFNPHVFVAFRSGFPFIHDLDLSRNAALEMLIYPNPTRDLIHVQGTIEGSEIEILDLTGRILYSTQSALNHLTLELDLATGTYLLKASRNKQQAVKRFTIL